MEENKLQREVIQWNKTVSKGGQFNGRKQFAKGDSLMEENSLPSRQIQGR